MNKLIYLVLIIITILGLVSCAQDEIGSQINMEDVKKLVLLEHHPIHSSDYGPVVHAFSNTEEIKVFIEMIKKGKKTNDNWLDFMNENLSTQKYDVQKEENKNWIVIGIYQNPLSAKYSFINQEDEKDSIVYSVEDSSVIKSFLNLLK